jgi:hypothetical protein
VGRWEDGYTNRKTEGQTDLQILAVYCAFVYTRNTPPAQRFARKEKYKFYDARTVHIGIKLCNDQRNAQVFNFIYLFTSVLHVSGFLLAHLQRQMYNFGSGTSFLGMVLWTQNATHHVTRILWMGVLCLVTWCYGLRSPRTSLDSTRPSTMFYRLLLNWASLRRH